MVRRPLRRAMGTMALLDGLLAKLKDGLLHLYQLDLVLDNPVDLTHRTSRNAEPPGHRMMTASIASVSSSRSSVGGYSRSPQRSHARNRPATPPASHPARSMHTATKSSSFVTAVAPLKPTECHDIALLLAAVLPIVGRDPLYRLEREDANGREVALGARVASPPPDDSEPSASCRPDRRASARLGQMSTDGLGVGVCWRRWGTVAECCPHSAP